MGHAQLFSGVTWGNPKTFDPSKMPMIMGNHFISTAKGTQLASTKAVRNGADWGGKASSAHWCAIACSSSVATF